MVFSYWLLGWHMKNNSSTSVEGVLPRGVPLFFAHAASADRQLCGNISTASQQRERLAIRTIEFAILVLFMICPRLSYLLLQIHVPAVALTICFSSSMTNSVQGITWRLGFGIFDPTQPEGMCHLSRLFRFHFLYTFPFILLLQSHFRSNTNMSLSIRLVYPFGRE